MNSGFCDYKQISFFKSSIFIIRRFYDFKAVFGAFFGLVRTDILSLIDIQVISSERTKIQHGATWVFSLCNRFQGYIMDRGVKKNYEYVG